MPQKIHFVDTHTGGEATRVLFDSKIDLGPGDMMQRREIFRNRFDHFRRGLVCEPRGSDVIVGALLTEPVADRSCWGVIFFNNLGFLGMCGHGMIGVAVAMQYLGRIQGGEHWVDTPVGSVSFELFEDNRVALQNVTSFRYRQQVPVALSDGQTVHGDIAWGGNWFFICEDHGLSLQLSELARLEQKAWQIRQALNRLGICGLNGAEIDHIELIGPPSDTRIADSKNFVLCPGGVFDRSPCGTGTSAKLACLAADGKLAPGQVYRQESMINSVFEASYRLEADGKILPTICGSAYVISEGHQIFDSRDPFCFGFENGQSEAARMATGNSQPSSPRPSESTQAESAS